MNAIRGFAPYKPTRPTRLLLDQVQDIFVANSAYLPLSLRQLFYLGVSAFAWPKTENFYDSLSKKLTRARRAGLVSFGDIRDDSITEETPRIYRSRQRLLDSIEYSVRKFTLDHMLRQERDVVVWTEGRGLVPMVRQFTQDFYVPVITSGGFDGITIKHQIAQRFSDRSAVVLHIGDYDPSGEVMFRALAEDVAAFGGDVEFRSIAISRDQVDQYGLPTKPPKVAGNTHALSFGDDRTVELEALPPALLRETLTAALAEVIDPDILSAALDQSRGIRAELLEKLGLG